MFEKVSSVLIYGASLTASLVLLILLIAIGEWSCGADGISGSILPDKDFLELESFSRNSSFSASEFSLG